MTGSRAFVREAVTSSTQCVSRQRMSFMSSTEHTEFIFTQKIIATGAIRVGGNVLAGVVKNWFRPVFNPFH